MNKTNQEKAKRIYSELKLLNMDIEYLLREEGRMCEIMTTKKAVPYARTCSTLYDARDCVVAAMRYLKYVIAIAEKQQEKEKTSEPELLTDKTEV